MGKQRDLSTLSPAYRKRLESGMAKGRSRSQSAGKPHKNEASITEAIEKGTLAPARQSKQKQVVSPKQFSELAKAHGGSYQGPTSTAYNSRTRKHKADFYRLQDALAFSKSLPATNSLYIKQFGYQKNFVSKDTDRTGTYVWRSISQLMTPDYVPRAEKKIIQRSEYLFDQHSLSEFSVVWGKA